MSFLEFMWIMRGYLTLFLIYGVIFLLAVYSISNACNKAKSKNYRITWGIIGAIAIYFVFTRYDLISYRWDDFDRFYTYWKLGILNY